MKSSQIILREEFEELKDKPLSDLGYTIELSDNNILKWRVTLLGAKDTSYAEGIFFIELRFPEDYPQSSPRVIFLTPIYHPNVSPNGFVAVNFIINWKASTRVREILTKLYAIFYDVNPNSPYSREQAEEFKNNRSLYESKVKYFTKKYANIKSSEDIKIFDKWNFFLEKNNINLCININGKDEFLMTFPLDRLVREVIKEIGYKYGRNLEREGHLLCIFNGKKLDDNKTLWENGLEDQSHVTIISGVHF